MYCVSIHDDIYNKILKLGYLPVGLGNNINNNNWITDKFGDNISHKNKFYGEYTFHYFFWKNIIHKIPNDEWIGFCGYRRFWLNKSNKNSKNIRDLALSNIPSEWKNYETIIGDQLNIQNVPWIKIIKYGKISILTNPKAIFKSGRNIKFHFDMFHGNGILDKAIDQLDADNKSDFKDFVYSKKSFNQGNMFITRSKDIMNKYYSTIFQWLEKCEKVFGFDHEGYGKVRVYGFLAERFLSYWFQKNTKYLEWPVIFYDLKNES